MRRSLLILFLILGCVFVSFSEVRAQEPASPGYVPAWEIGARWLVEATYRDLKVPGEVWLPPIRWVFKVRTKKMLQQQECYVLHIFPQTPDMKLQAILYLSVNNLRLLRVIDIFPSQGKVTHTTRDVDIAHPQPLLSEGSLVPYDLPLFPLVKQTVQAADSFDAYREPEARKIISLNKIGGLTFKRTFTQKDKAPDKQHADLFSAYRYSGDTFQVELCDVRSKETLVQVWQDGAPWAISSESPSRKVRLVPPSPPTPLPPNPSGGTE